MKKVLHSFRGEAPKKAEHALDDNQATIAFNVDLRRGLLEPARLPTPVGIDLGSGDRSLYWFARDTYNPPVNFILPSFFFNEQASFIAGEDPYWDLPSGTTTLNTVGDWSLYFTAQKLEVLARVDPANIATANIQLIFLDTVGREIKTVTLQASHFDTMGVGRILEDIDFTAFDDIAALKVVSNVPLDLWALYFYGIGKKAGKLFNLVEYATDENPEWPWTTGVALPDGNIFCVPQLGNTFGLLDTVTNKVTAFTIALNHTLAFPNTPIYVNGRVYITTSRPSWSWSNNPLYSVLFEIDVTARTAKSMLLNPLVSAGSPIYAYGQNKIVIKQAIKKPSTLFPEINYATLEPSFFGSSLESRVTIRSLIADEDDGIFATEGFYFYDQGEVCYFSLDYSKLLKLDPRFSSYSVETLTKDAVFDGALSDYDGVGRFEREGGSLNYTNVNDTANVGTKGAFGNGIWAAPIDMGNDAYLSWPLVMNSDNGLCFVVLKNGHLSLVTATLRGAFQDSTNLLEHWVSRKAKMLWANNVLWLWSGFGIAAYRFEFLAGKPVSVEFAGEFQSNYLSHSALDSAFNLQGDSVEQNNDMDVMEMVLAKNGNLYLFGSTKYRKYLPYIDTRLVSRIPAMGDIVNVIVIPANSLNINLRDLFLANAGSNAATLSPVFVIEEGIAVGSAVNTKGAIETGYWPAHQIPRLIIRAGENTGVFGFGGMGKTRYPTAAQDALTNGGPAVVATSKLIIENYATIGGGGGGGPWGMASEDSGYGQYAVDGGRGAGLLGNDLFDGGYSDADDGTGPAGDLGKSVLNGGKAGAAIVGSQFVTLLGSGQIHGELK